VGCRRSFCKTLNLIDKKDTIEEFSGSVPEESVSKHAVQTSQSDNNPAFHHPVSTPYTPQSFFDYQYEYPTPAFVGDDIPWHEGMFLTKVNKSDKSK